MSKSFLARLPLAASAVDRDYLSRESEESIAALLADPATRFLVLRSGLALLESPTSLALLERVEPVDDLIYLGRAIDGGTPVFAAIVGEHYEGDFGNLRSLGGVLSPLHATLFAEALAMANWHRVTGFSPLSGAATTPAKGGWVLRDSETGAELFPRTDMAVIVGVTDADDRLLLGSNAQWESNRYSLLAGFVEPGESLEAAVAREVFEESGIRVTDPRYLGSQPWPFPASLMLGFLARVDESAESALRPDGIEIVDLRWFSRAELHAALAEIRLPGPTSIARAIIEEWYGGPVEVAP
jgi:NAD+ diphosphatase